MEETLGGKELTVAPLSPGRSCFSSVTRSSAPPPGRSCFSAIPRTSTVEAMAVELEG